MKSVLKIALGVFLGFSLTYLGWMFFTVFALGQILGVADTAIHNELESTYQHQIKKIRNQENLKKQKELQQQRLEREKRKKDFAWGKWYQDRQPVGCNSWKSDKHMVDCINHKMRSKTMFDKLWAQGKIVRKTI